MIRFTMPRAGLPDGHAVVVGQVVGRPDAVRPRGQEQQLALGFLARDGAGMVLVRDQAFRQVEDAGEVGPAPGDRQQAPAEVCLEHGPRHSPGPVARDPPVDPLSLRQVLGGQGAAAADLIEHPGGVLRPLLHE